MNTTILRAISISILAFSLIAVPPAMASQQSNPKMASVDYNKLYQELLALYQYDRSQPLSVVITKIKQYPECVMLRVSYASGNGERVPAVVFEPFRASRWHPVPAVILLHGLGGSKEDLVPFGHFLAATGYASLIIDEFGHGERQSTDKTVGAGDAIRGFEQTVVDVRRGIDYLQTRAHVSPSRIGILGFSLGAIIGADVMGIDPRIKAGVLISGGGNVGTILKHLSENSPRAHERLTGFNWDFANVLLTGIDPLTFASHISPRPVLMQNGDADPIVTPDCAKALYNALAADNKKHVEIDWCRGCGHFLPLGKIYPHMRTWLDKNLKGEMNDADVEIMGSQAL